MKQIIWYRSWSYRIGDLINKAVQKSIIEAIIRYFLFPMMLCGVLDARDGQELLTKAMRRINAHPNTVGNNILDKLYPIEALQDQWIKYKAYFKGRWEVDQSKMLKIKKDQVRWDPIFEMNQEQKSFKWGKTKVELVRVRTEITDYPNVMMKCLRNGCQNTIGDLRYGQWRREEEQAENESGNIRMYTDGAQTEIAGKENRAGIGIANWNKELCFAGQVESTGQTTNNQAEMAAIVIAIKAAAMRHEKAGIKQIIVYSDSAVSIARFEKIRQDVIENRKERRNREAMIEYDE